MLIPLPWQWYKFPKENRELSIVPFSEGAAFKEGPTVSAWRANKSQAYQIVFKINTKLNKVKCYGWSQWEKKTHCSQLNWDRWYYYPVCETFNHFLWPLENLKHTGKYKKWSTTGNARYAAPHAVLILQAMQWQLWCNIKQLQEVALLNAGSLLLKTWSISIKQIHNCFAIRLHL